MLQVGDLVRIIEPIDRNEWPHWVPDMDQLIGTERRVRDVHYGLLMGAIVYIVDSTYVFNEKWLVKLNSYKSADIKSIFE